MDRSQAHVRLALGVVWFGWDTARQCEVLSAPVWTTRAPPGPPGECLARDNAVFEEGIQMLVYYRLSRRGADKEPQRSSCRQAAPHTDTHSRGKINVYGGPSPFDSGVLWTAELSGLDRFSGCGSRPQHLHFDSMLCVAYRFS
ncbi:Hypothetical protein SMAX5B_018015 [Scophthalmus maximus]|uniref:Uncharacterized protein n=1 Tax=Scophthalmus maximus TaxID=52904 RepID=A0A2U9CBP4_SCOMX|nr:Hypothetical protein SMAX5B_018015 [Scophthalmus maximus]